MFNKQDKLTMEYLERNRFAYTHGGKFVKYFRRQRKCGDFTVEVRLYGSRSHVKIYDPEEARYDEEYYEECPAERRNHALFVARGQLTCGEMEKILRKLNMKVYCRCV